jgi:phospholipid transport system substrate-binding protein
MIRYRRVSLLLVALLVLCVGPEAWAGAPTDQLRGAIDRVIKTLEDPTLKAPDKVKERRSEVRKIANDTFDFKETAQRSLARHWQARTEKEREEFIVLFGELMERSYISKIEIYGGEKILYTGESVDGDIATVRTKILAKGGTDVPVDYRLLRRGDRWLVYDVSVEGVSLVNNYRTQFNKIIQTSSYQELVKKMKTKQEEFLFEEEAKAKGMTNKKK